MSSWTALEDAGYGEGGSSVVDYNAMDECDALYYFDPNDKRYRCCCQQSHATTGVRIIAGMLWMTVLLEVWHLGWLLLISDSGGAPVVPTRALADGSVNGSIGDFDESSAITSSITQLLVGVGIATTIVCALWTENAAFLLPYLFLQTIGLVAVFIILFALIYITLANDLETIRAFVESHGPNVDSAAPTNNERYLIYMGWTMVGSCMVLLALQWWLISIVFACWRYFRDKRNFGYSKGYTSSAFVVFCAKNGPKLRDASKSSGKGMLLTSSFRFMRSVSLDGVCDYNPSSHPPLIQQSKRPSRTTSSSQLPLRGTFSSLSID